MENNTMSSKTIYISDLDGTLLNEKAEISDYTADTLNKLIANGLQFSFATARTAATVVKMTEKINIELPVVLMNGALIYDIKKDKYINVEAIERGSVEKIVSAMKRHDISGFAYTIENGGMKTYYDELKTSAMREFYNERRKKFNKQFTRLEKFDEIAERPVVYFSFLNSEEKLKPMFEELSKISGITIEYYRDIYDTDRWYLELLSDKASKYHAVNFLRGYMSADLIVGFGDNLNDIPLFKACDKRYAVENANPTLKELADDVIESNRNDGVARFLEYLVKESN
jgi:hypothetical protein